MDRHKSQAPISGALALAGLGAATAALGALSLSGALFPKQKKQFSLADWEAACDVHGRLYSSVHLFERVSSTGLEPGLRNIIWPLLLGIYSADSTADQRAVKSDELEGDYQRLLMQAKEKCEAEGDGDQIMEVHRSIILDVLRTPLLQGSPSSSCDSVCFKDQVHEETFKQQRQRDKAAVVRCITPTVQHTLEEAALGSAASSRVAQLFNLLAAHQALDPHLGYAQGMSDLAAIFLCVFEDDISSAFWCFAAMMRSLRANFDKNEVGIRSSLSQIAWVIDRVEPLLMRRLEQLDAKDCLFAYRMVVVQLLRELTPLQAKQLWEMSWAAEAIKQLHVSKQPEIADGLLAAEQHQERDPENAITQLPVDAADDVCPPLLQCFIVEAIRSQRQAIFNECTHSDAILALFSSLPLLNFRSLISSALRLRTQLLPQPSFQDLLAFEISA